MAQTGEIDVATVRTAMNEVDEMKFASSTIEQKISDAETIITHRLNEQDEALAALDQDVFNIAVTALAKWKVWMSSPQEVRRGALDLNVTYDVQSYTNRLKDERDHALALIGLSQGGASADIADKTDGVWDRSWEV